MKIPDALGLTILIFPLLNLVGRRERAHPRAASHDVLHGIPRLFPRRRPLLRQAGHQLLHRDQGRVPGYQHDFLI